MAAVSAWSKPGAWALEAEEQDEQQQEFDNNDKGYDSSSESHHSASADFPSLSSAAATTKVPKKKSKKLTLAEFATTKFQGDSSLVLPTGPRERSAEELDRSRLGGGFRYGSYNSDGARGGSDESRRERREPRALDSGPSRADEADDWGATKKSVGAGSNSERRERSFFGSSQSKADESDDWVSAKKSYTPPPSGEGRRERERRGFDFNKEGGNGRGADSDSWGRKMEENGGSRVGLDNWGRKKEDNGRTGMNSDSWGKKREENGGSGVGSDNWGSKKVDNGRSGMDSDSWGKKREENGGSERPRLVLQPRSVLLVNGNNGEDEKKEGEVAKSSSKVGNPFGEARPREEVLKEKGMDWKEIDEKLEAVKIEEVATVGRKENGSKKDDRTENAWRKPETPSRS